MPGIGVAVANRLFGGRFALLDAIRPIEYAQGPQKAPVLYKEKHSMPVTLRIRDDLSVNDIVELGRHHLVKATPHVGNWTPARLALPALGISILCVDHTIGIKDRNTHPHLFIHEGEAQALCEDADRLTTHTRVTREARGGTHAAGASLSDVHVGALRSLYPSADILTHSEHLRKYRDITLAVLEEATCFSRSSTWWRRVDGDGVVTCYRRKDLPGSWQEFKQDIFSLTNERHGWLIHNRVAILMDVIQQSQMGEEPEIYHLSGPDMVRYLGGEIETISGMYDHVRSRLGLAQETIVFNLIPFASFRFATRASQAPACVALCEEIGKDIPDENRLRAFAQEATDVFAEPETQNYFTQHDCLSSGERIMMPDAAREWPMALCGEHLAKIKVLA